MAKGPIKDKVLEREGRPDHLQDMRARLLDETQIWAQLDIAPLLVFAPFRAAPFPRGCFLGHLRSGGCVLLLQLFQHDRVGGAVFDTDQRETQKTQPRDRFAIEG